MSYKLSSLNSNISELLHRRASNQILNIFSNNENIKDFANKKLNEPVFWVDSQ